MLDIIAASYMSAVRMEHFIEQDLMHKDPRIAQRLRRAHGIDGAAWERQERRKNRPVIRPAIRWVVRKSLAALGLIGHGLRRTGEAFERASSRSFQREINPGHAAPEGAC